jgi:hypothetical protein
MAEEILLGSWEQQQAGRDANAMWKQPFVVIEARLVLSSNSLTNPDEDVAALCKMKLSAPHGPGTIDVECEYHDEELQYNALMHVANIREVAESLEKQAAEWVKENGF